jgi:hypothetical protein
MGYRSMGVGIKICTHESPKKKTRKSKKARLAWRINWWQL